MEGRRKGWSHIENENSPSYLVNPYLKLINQVIKIYVSGVKTKKKTYELFVREYCPTTKNKHK